MLIDVGLMLLGATVGLHVDDARGVSNEEIRALTDSLGAAIKKRTGEAPVLDLGGTCEEEDRCARQIRSRTGAKQLVFLNLVGVSTKIRLVAERLDEGSSSVVQQAQADLKRDKESWPAALDGVSLILFPDATPPPAPIAEAPPAAPPASPAAAAEPPGGAKPLPSATLPPKEKDPLKSTAPIEQASTSPLPWIMMGAGAASGLVGVLVGAGAQAARNKLATQPTTQAERPALRDTAVNGAIGADILFVVTALTVGGAALMLADVF